MRLLFLVLIYTFFSSALFSQKQITLTGTVTDSSTGEPLAFVYVKLSDLALGTVTNGEGAFVLHLAEAYSEKNIEFSYLGYVRKTYSIADLQEMKTIAIQLKRDVTQIREVVIKPEKSISAKKLLAKVIKNIEQNYAQIPVYLNGYYRETVAENGAFISYADAAVQVHYAPYQEDSYNWKQYWTEGQSTVYTLSTSNVNHGKTLHRGHFHNATISDDQAKVIDSRSSANLTKTDMYAHVEGGPMGIFSKDYVKYKAAFFGDKKFKQFDFEIGEVLLNNSGYVYVLSFRTLLAKDLLDELAVKNKSKAFNKTVRNKVLEGRIYIDKHSYAVLKFECSVPAELKDYFCSYTTMNYKHFDYKLHIEYQKIGDKYYLKYLRHEDEFILNDTITNSITPYYAVSQFWVDSVTTENVEKFSAAEVFANMPSNRLFELALEYHPDFWKNYTLNNPRAIIPDSIRMEMEVSESLEKQFDTKHHRNDSLEPPVAMEIPIQITLNDTTLTDNYAWLKQPKNALHNTGIRDYLMAENAYTDNYFVPLRKNQRELFTELTARIVKEDESIPIEQDGYWYLRKWTEENEYPIYMRRREGSDT